LFKLINGYRCAPKIKALYRIIKWYKYFYIISINPLGLYLFPINSKRLLAGFTDGYENFTINITNFTINITNRKKKRCNYY